MYPDSASIDYAYYQMGQSYLKDGDNTEAFKAFDGLITALPHSALADDAQFALGWVNFPKEGISARRLGKFNKLIQNFSYSDLAARAY